MDIHVSVIQGMIPPIETVTASRASGILPLYLPVLSIRVLLPLHVGTLL